MGNTLSQSVNVVLLGIQNAGKTRFFYSAKQLPFSSDSDPTQGFNCEEITGFKKAFHLWDFGGDPGLRRSWPVFAANLTPVGMIYVIEVTSEIDNFPEAKKELHLTLNQDIFMNLVLLVVYNVNEAKMGVDMMKPSREVLDKMLGMDEITECAIKHSMLMDVTGDDEVERALKWMGNNLAKKKKPPPASSALS